MRQLASLCIVLQLCVLSTRVDAVEFKVSGPSGVCRLSGGSTVRVSHSAASTTTIYSGFAHISQMLEQAVMPSVELGHQAHVLSSTG